MSKNCIYLKQKLNRKLYCKKLKKDILISQCSNCKYKEYPIVQKNNKNWNTDKNAQYNAKNCEKNTKMHNKIRNTVQINSKPSKRTKALAIPKKVKLIVWERDKHECIFCHTPVPWNLANSHFIKRSHGGLGIEQNIMTNCESCHEEFEHGKTRKEKIVYAENYLKSKYDNWNKDNLVYKK